MSATGGPPETISIAGREFRCTGDSSPSVQLGGFNNEYQSNGDGSTRTIKTRIPWSISGLEVEVDTENEDFEFLNDVKDGADDVDVVLTYSNGTSYAGTGGIEGDLVNDQSKAAAGFEMKGPGKLKKI